MSTSDHTPIPDGYKRCSKCNEIKPFSSFSKERKSRDGLQFQCKNCKAKQDALYRAKNQDRLKERSRAYCQTHRKEAVERANAWNRAHPERRAATTSRYAKKHPQKVNQNTRKYKSRHRDHIAEYNAQYRIAHQQEMREYARQYYYSHRAEAAQYHKNNPHVGRIGAQRRRARIRNLPSTFNVQDEQRMFDYFEHRCAVCGKPRGLWHTLALDHWIPISSPDCPGTIPTNIVPLCHAVNDGQGGCNNSKLNRDPHKWLVSEFGKAKAAKIEARIQAYFDSLKDEQK